MRSHSGHTRPRHTTPHRAPLLAKRQGGHGDPEPLKERQRLGELVLPLPLSGTTESCPPLREFRSGYRDKVFLTLSVYLDDFDLMLFSFLPQSIKGESLPPDLNRLTPFSAHPYLRGHPATPRIPLRGSCPWRTQGASAGVSPVFRASLVQTGRFPSPAFGLAFASPVFARRAEGDL